jgi:uncharacterized protein
VVKREEARVKKAMGKKQKNDSMYHLLTEGFKSQEKELVRLISEAVPIDKIYLLGSTLQQRRTESIFMTDAPTCSHVGHYYLLVLAAKANSHCNDALQDKIENTCRHFIPVTVIVATTAQFNKWLNGGHRFACTVIKTAVLLHDGSGIPLSTPAAVNEEEDKIYSANYFHQGVNRVKEFMAGAVLYQVRVQYKMAAFMLHQAAEHALGSIFKKATGLHINTHNIDKLVRYCTMLSYKIPALFPKEGEVNARLFQLLQKAYIDTRYKDEFNISNADLTILVERVKSLQQLMLGKDFCYR